MDTGIGEFPEAVHVPPEIFLVSIAFIDVYPDRAVNL